MVSISLAATSVPAIVFPPVVQQVLSGPVASGRISLAAALHTPLAGIGAILVFGAVVLGAMMNRDGGGPPPEEAVRTPWRAFVTPLAAVIVLLAGLHGGADTALYSWLPKLMTSRFSHLPVAPGAVLAAYSLAYLVARTLQATLPEGLGQRAFLTLAGPLGGITLLAAMWFGGPLALGLLYPLAGLIWCLEYPALLAEIGAASPRQFSSVLAAAQLASCLVAAGQLNLVGWLADLTGDLRVALLPAVCSFVAFGVIAAAVGLGRARPGAAERAG